MRLPATHATPILGAARFASRTGRSVVLGAALSAIALSAALGEPAQIVKTPGRVDVAIPATDLVDLPAVKVDEFAKREHTGSVDHPPAAATTLEGAAPAAPIVAPVVTVQPADPVAAAILALLANDGAASGLPNARRDGPALAKFYADRASAPLWLAGGHLSPKADAAKARIAAAADDALDPKRYPTPADAGADAAAHAKADLQLTAAALAYAREAWGGRVAPKSLSGFITAEPPSFDAVAALAQIASASDVAATLDAFNPPHPQFHALRKLLLERRADAPAATKHPIILDGPLLKPGGEDARVPALRIRLGLTGDADDRYYDDILADAVMTFQKERKIGASGLINRQTIRALNGGAIKRDPSAVIALNMERWRWLPRDLGAKHVFVDIPAFELHIMQDGRSTYDTRVIVGKPENQTPIFSHAINHVVVNPYWNVPVSIAMNEMRNGSLRGFEVVDSRGKKVDYVDWEGIRTNKYRIRQPPGERNALGNIKFMFPNQHSVYLHDTSSRKLFDRDYRSLSHGCVRVDKPFEFADALSGDQGISGDALKKIIGGKERRINLTTEIPVHLTYFTAWVDESGQLSTRSDLYGHDERLRAALAGERLPPDPAVKASPRIVRAPAPKPTRSASVVPEDVVEAPRSNVASPSGWLSRIFGSSR